MNFTRSVSILAALLLVVTAITACTQPAPGGGESEPPPGVAPSEAPASVEQPEASATPYTAPGDY